MEGDVARHDCIGGCDSQKSSGREITFVSACFSSSVFIMTLVSCNEHGNLWQVNVRVKIINKPEGNWDICSVTGRDETRCTVVKPVLYRGFRRCRSFIRVNTRRAECGEIRETQKRGVEENMRGVIGIGKGSCKSKCAV